MNFDVYCDESYQDCLSFSNHNNVRYMLIGGLWLPSETKNELKKRLKILKVAHHALGELKWSKVSPSKILFYKDLIDLFMSYGANLRFRIIVVEQDKIIWNLHNDDRELGFYKFYYHMLHHWITENNEYKIYCDKKVNKNKKELVTLHRCLSKANIYADIKNVCSLDSKDSVILQYADFFTGLVAAKFNNTVESGSAKYELISYLEEKLGRKISHTSRSEIKFNIFAIQLDGGW